MSSCTGYLRATACFVVLALPLLFCSPASADLILEVQPTITLAAPSSTGNVFEIDLVNTDNTTYQLSGFNVSFSAPLGSGISFDSADTSTNQPYLLSGNSVLFLFANVGDPTIGDISDNANDLMQTIAGNTTYGLGRIFFSVAPSTSPGLVPVTIDPVLSTLSGPPPNFDFLPFGTSDGEISISVPEPSSLCMLGIGMVLVSTTLCRRRFRTSRGKERPYLISSIAETDE